MSSIIQIMLFILVVVAITALILWLEPDDLSCKPKKLERRYNRSRDCPAPLEPEE